MTRRSHRVDHDRSFLTLKLVNCSDTGARNSFLKFEYLRIVGRNDEDIFQRH